MQCSLGADILSYQDPEDEDDDASTEYSAVFTALGSELEEEFDDLPALTSAGEDDRQDEEDSGGEDLAPPPKKRKIGTISSPQVISAATRKRGYSQYSLRQKREAQEADAELREFGHTTIDGVVVRSTQQLAAALGLRSEANIRSFRDKEWDTKSAKER